MSADWYDPPPPAGPPGWLDADTGRPYDGPPALEVVPEPGLDVEAIADAMDADPDAASALAELTAKPELRTQRASEVIPAPVRWLWPGRMPRGKTTLFEGDPATNKTTALIDLCARLSRADLMPDGIAPDPGPRGVLFVSSEDDPGDTLVPRLHAARADLQQVHFLEPGEHLDLSERLEYLRGTILRHRVGLVVLDPLTAMLGATDAYRDAEVRAVLAPLAALAAETNAAVVGIRHLRKGRGRAMEAGGGSIAFAAAARSVLLVGRVPDAPPDDPRRVLASTKCNLAFAPPSLAFEVQSHEGPWGSVPVVVWRGESPHTADELASAESARAKPSPRRDEAATFLQEALADGPVPQEDLKEEAEALGITWRTVRRAKETLGICSAKRPGQAGRWVWFLPTEEGGHALGAKGHGQHGHLTRVSTKDDHEGHEACSWKVGHLAGGPS